MKGTRLAIGTLLLAMAACGDSDGSEDLVGTWVGTGNAPEEVTMTLSDDGSFTWSILDLTGTWEADDTTLTLAFPEDSPFCAGGELRWEYRLGEDTLTSDVVGGDCPEGVELGPPSPDWRFERQSSA
ncbi:MAG TPA: hypothetical protein VF029_03780 [Actinomycetota bacterium]